MDFDFPFVFPTLRLCECDSLVPSVEVVPSEFEIPQDSDSLQLEDVVWDDVVLDDDPELLLYPLPDEPEL